MPINVSKKAMLFTEVNQNVKFIAIEFFRLFDLPGKGANSALAMFKPKSLTVNNAVANESRNDLPRFAKVFFTKAEEKKVKGER